jgi:L-asparaginase
LQDIAGKDVIAGAADFSLKDSKDITAEDVQRMAHLIAQAQQDFIIITHGTDAMPQNARMLKALLARDYPEVLAHKRIVFTGAMEPLTHGAQSDGYANLKDALRDAKAGVSIVMHGMVINPDRAVKDFANKAIIER